MRITGLERQTVILFRIVYCPVDVPNRMKGRMQMRFIGGGYKMQINGELAGQNGQLIIACLSESDQVVNLSARTGTFVLPIV